jgi:uncharacterized membrane protein YjgN (DUF898 family)
MSDLPPSGPATSETTRVPFRFHGQGGEYFRIWIVNLLLTILTLGIYSAWAKVRTKRYFYRNTELDGDRFDYLASPIAILKGRLIAVAALAGYTLLGLFAPLASLILLVLLLLCLPWIVVRALRFNAVMSSWRGIRFGFEGKSVDAFIVFILWQVFGLLTLGFGMPFAWHKQNQFMINHYRFGQTRGLTTARTSDFFIIFFVLMGVGVGAVIVLMLFGVVAALAGGMADNPEGLSGPIFIVLLVLMYFLVYVAAYAVYQAMYFNVVYNHIEIADNRVRNSVSVGGYFTVILVNSLLIVLTLGIFYPWAAVRLSRYLQSHLWVEATDLDSFVAHEADHVTALGDEIGEAFDLGIGI